jgi:hypothetical protein
MKKGDRSLMFDESGGLGGRGRCFVLACVETREWWWLHKAMKDKLDQVRDFLPFFAHQHEIKASALYAFPTIKEDMLATIAAQNIRISYIVVDKPRIDKALFNDKNALYDYLMVVLLDRVIARGCQGERIKIICDTLPGNAEDSLKCLKNYLAIHFNLERQYNLTLDIEARDSSKENAYTVQAADYIANAIYLRYAAGEDRFYKQIEHKIVAAETFPSADSSYQVGSGLCAVCQ